MSARRYEILLPLKDNHGREIDPAKFLQTKNDLVRRFGALTVEPQPLQGVWAPAGEAGRMEDILLKFVVDVEEDTPEVEEFFRQFKEALKARFDQLDVWIVAFPIRII